MTRKWTPKRVASDATKQTHGGRMRTMYSTGASIVLTFKRATPKKGFFKIFATKISHILQIA